MANPDLNPDWEVCDPNCDILFEENKWLLDENGDYVLDEDGHRILNPNWNDGAWEQGGTDGNVIDLEDDSAADNARGGAGDDAMYGDEQNNRLEGEEGQDTCSAVT